MTVRAALYARVCVDDGQNLVEQLEACRAHARELGWNIVQESAEQGSGSNASHLPQLSHLLELARAGAFDVLIVRDPHRLSRDLPKLLDIEAALHELGCEIRYVSPGSLTAAHMLQAVAAALPTDLRKQITRKES